MSVLFLHMVVHVKCWQNPRTRYLLYALMYSPFTLNFKYPVPIQNKRSCKRIKHKDHIDSNAHSLFYTDFGTFCPNCLISGGKLCITLCAAISVLSQSWKRSSFFTFLIRITIVDFGTVNMNIRLYLEMAALQWPILSRSDLIYLYYVCQCSCN